MAHEQSENLRPPLSPYDILTLFFLSLSLTRFPIHTTNMQWPGLAAHRRFSNANFTRRHHHLICISSRLYTLFSLYSINTHSTDTHITLAAAIALWGSQQYPTIISSRLDFLYTLQLFCFHARPAWIGVVVSRVYHEMCLCIIQPIYIYVVCCVVYSFPLLTMRNFIIHITAIAEEMEQ
jgi:hypothetical protein